jgi:predicted GTPase
MTETKKSQTEEITEEKPQVVEKSPQTKLEPSSLQKKLNAYTCEDLKIVKHVNILLIGEKGSGKSSLISTFHRALHNNYGENPIADVGSNVTSVLLVWLLIPRHSP